MKPPASPGSGAVPRQQPAGDQVGGAFPLMRGRTALTLIFILVAATGGILWHLHRQSENSYQTLAVQGAELQAHTFSEFRKLYTSEVVARVEKHGIKATHDYKNRDKAIPL